MSETYDTELRRFKKWMRGQKFDVIEGLAALVVLGKYGYEETVKRLNRILNN